MLQDNFFALKKTVSIVTILYPYSIILQIALYHHEQQKPIPYRQKNGRSGSIMFFELLTIFLLARNMNKQDELENRVNQLENKTTLRYEYDGEQVEDLA